VTIRCLELVNLEAELQQIYELVNISFRHNFLYQPIPCTEFMQQYQTLLPYIKPELVFIAEYQQHPVGVLFAVPDWLEVQRGESLQTIIIKTLAVLPDRTYAGLGQVLIEHCHATALQAGYQRAIYALIHDDNPCRNLVQRYARLMRRYAVLAKAL
jgi:GNAT superfamily N-acetyltransferase